MAKLINTKLIYVDGQPVNVRVFSPASGLRERISNARINRSFECEREAQSEAAHLGIDLGHGYSAK